MLRWTAGENAADGIWASHWYGAVHRSTGFADPEGPLPLLSEGYEALVVEALPYYERLARYQLRL